MASEEHINLIKSGVEAWNRAREISYGQQQLARRWHFKPQSKIAIPDLQNADLSELVLIGCNLSHANLRNANLYRTALHEADLTHANLEGANLDEAVLDMANLNQAQLTRARLVGANLHSVSACGATFDRANLATSILVAANLLGATARNASFYAANLIEANLEGVDLRESDLQSAMLVDANVENARISGCSVYGLSAWRLKGDLQDQLNLVITPHDEPSVTIDNLEMAQFFYLLHRNKKLRDVIDALTTKVVLILGRFTVDRKPLLEAIREELRARGYYPVLFDFDKPKSRDTVETISLLAHVARFVIADLTDAKSVLQELQRIVPSLPSVPVQPLIIATQQGPGMFDHFRGFRSVLPVYEYESDAALLESLSQAVIAPAERAVGTY